MVFMYYVFHNFNKPTVHLLERLTANAKVATILFLIPASSDIVESEGRQTKQCWNKFLKNLKRSLPLNVYVISQTLKNQHEKNVHQSAPGHMYKRCFSIAVFAMENVEENTASLKICHVVFT
jgi:hypothetical protein